MADTWKEFTEKRNALLFETIDRRFEIFYHDIFVGHPEFNHSIFTREIFLKIGP